MVTTESLAKAIGRELPDYISTQLDELIDAASDLVAAHIGRPLAVVSATETVIAHGDASRIHLANTPIGSVTSISVDGDDLDLSLVRVADNYIDFRSTIVRPASTGVDCEVVYVGGVDLTATGDDEAGRRAKTVNGVIRDVAHRLARRMMDDRHDISEMRLEGMAVKYADGGEVGLLDSERRRLARYRRVGGARAS